MYLMYLMQHMELCVFNLPISLDCEKSFTSSYYQRHIRDLDHYQLFKVRPTNRNMQCMYFKWLPRELYTLCSMEYDHEFTELCWLSNCN